MLFCLYSACGTGWLWGSTGWLTASCLCEESMHPLTSARILAPIHTPSSISCQICQSTMPYNGLITYQLSSKSGHVLMSPDGRCCAIQPPLSLLLLVNLVSGFSPATYKTYKMLYHAPLCDRFYVGTREQTTMWVRGIEIQIVDCMTCRFCYQTGCMLWWIRIPSRQHIVCRLLRAVAEPWSSYH